MRYLVVVGLLAVLVVSAALWSRRHRVSPIRGGLELTGGRHIAVETDPAAPAADEFGAALSRLDSKEAEKIARRAVREYPASAGAHFHLGLAMHVRGRAGHAVAEFEEALRLDPTHPGASKMLSLWSETGPPDDPGRTIR
jgi:cytochrome c-type biogenesis protein CcmH/NrfG